MKEPGWEQSEQRLDELVQQIDRRRLALPALAFLEMMRPFSFVASQGLLLCQPLLGFFYDESRLAGYADLLADRANVERLITSLEALESASRQSSKEKSG